MSAEITETTAEEVAEVAAQAEDTAMEAVEVAAEAEEIAAEAEAAASEAEQTSAEAEVVTDEPGSVSAEAEEVSAEAEDAADAPEGPIVAPTNIADLKPKTKVKGIVKRVDLYGAIIDLGIDATALIHISKLGSEQVNRVSDVLNEGDTITAWVEKVDPERGQVMLTMVEPVAVDWSDLKEGQVYSGKVTRLENFGAFVSFGAEREGLVHISELSHDYVKNPGEVVSVGDEVTVKVLGFNRRKRRIDLSIKALIERPGQTTASGGGRGGKQQQSSYTPDASDYEEAEEEFEELPTAMEIALRRALGNEGMTSIKEQQRTSKKQKKHSTSKRQMQQEVIDRILQMTSEN